MASIMKRGNTYSVRYNYKDHAGKPCKGWETFKTKAEAQERKITVEKELLDGTFLVPDAMTVEEQASQLRYDAPAVKRLGIPAYNWWNEGLHGLARSGIATMFPQAIGLAAMFDTELTQKVADITAEEARAKYNAYTKYDDRDIYKGLTFWAPNINIFIISNCLMY